ncbi:pentapeptide repeat-containing protein [Microbispora sp. H10836]|uniref:pentapeptide repeat-containing protein n=1 Tax=Microbispora sp. H10836 TaxID=2729106 RepID=UPI0014735DC6
MGRLLRRLPDLLRGACLSGARLSGARLNGARLRGALRSGLLAAGVLRQLASPGVCSRLGMEVAH